MRRLLLLLMLALIPLQPASASTLTVIAEPATRNAAGVFINNQLAESVAPKGKLGALIFERTSTPRSFLVDMATIDEILDLVDGYAYIDSAGELVEVPELVIADIWLTTFKNLVRDAPTSVLPYGNPDSSFLRERAPAELRFLSLQAKVRIQALLLRDIPVAEGGVPDGSLSPQARTISNQYRRDLRVMYSIAPAPELLALRLEVAKMMNPKIAKPDFERLYQPLIEALNQNSKKLRVARGNYTITASNYDLPVTVINDYSVPVKINLRARPTNSRIIVGSIPSLEVPANSQSQVAVPIQVIASGDTQIEFQMLKLGGKQVGSAEYIPLRLAVISPLTTWFTTGMAIILLLAAALQSIRRVKKRKRS